ncbi:hypothetical protein ACET3Z_025566 [Daucus carota]
MGKDCHPLLKGGRRESKYTHGLTSSDMETLASLCEVFLPPIQQNSAHDIENAEPSGEHIQSFLKASGSENLVPDEVAEILMKRGFFEGVLVVRLVLRILCSRLGTFLLCGSLCLGNKWPYCNKFSRIPLEKREQVVQKWFRHSFLTPIRLGFIFIKFLCTLVFFSQANENSENPAWKAIGYNVDNLDQKLSEKEERPLAKGMVETIYETDSSFVRSLTQKGLTVTKDPKLVNTYKFACDVVIVGSGCGGGVAASVLARSGYKVVVLEKGNYFTKNDYSSLEGPSMNKLYENGVDAGAVIISGCKAEKFVIEKNSRNSNYERTRKKKCLGVIASFNLKENNNINKKSILHIKARVTISACGALLTPPLMISSGLRNQNIGLNLHLHPVVMAWGYFPEETSLEFKGKHYQGGIITSVHKVVDSKSNDVRAVIEAAALLPGSFAGLCPWKSGLDYKTRMLKYARTAHLFAMIKEGYMLLL